MYLVITEANCVDSTMAILVPRLITADFQKALDLARDENAIKWDFVSQLIIFELTLEQVYSLEDVRRFCDDNRPGPVVYVRRWQFKLSNTDVAGWGERFFREELELEYALIPSAKNPAD